jgi:hypothetical protein
MDKPRETGAGVSQTRGKQIASFILRVNSPMVNFYLFTEQTIISSRAN